MRENNRKPIEKCRRKLPQFTTMNVIDGQAGLVIYSSLIFYSLTIDNILNIIVLLILAGVSIATLTGENGILTQAQNAKKETEDAAIDEQNKLNEYENFITGDVTKTTDTTPGVLDGEGTTDNPYKIESVEDLVAFFKDIVDGNEFEGNIIELTNTLDLTSANSYVDVNSTAFGDYNGDGNVTGIFDEINNKNYTGLKLANDIFKGTLDGQGNEIRNIYTNLYNQNAELGFIGVCKGTIKDISISGEYKIYYTDDYYRIGAMY